MEIRFTDTSFKQLAKIAKGDKSSARRIKEKINEYACNKSVKHDVKLLKGDLGTIYRLRVGDYRILFTIVKRVMIIAEIKHRQGSYHD